MIDVFEAREYEYIGDPDTLAKLRNVFGQIRRFIGQAHGQDA